MVFYSLILATVFCMVSVADITVLPITISPVEAKPNHGECFLNNGTICQSPAMHIQYDGENCVECICDEGLADPGLLCCMVEPFPLVNMPEHCDRYLNTTSCLYEFLEFCPDACIVTGYEYSEADFLPSPA